MLGFRLSSRFRFSGLEHLIFLDLQTRYYFTRLCYFQEVETLRFQGLITSITGAVLFIALRIFIMATWIFNTTLLYLGLLIGCSSGFLFLLRQHHNSLHLNSLPMKWVSCCQKNNKHLHLPLRFLTNTCISIFSTFTSCSSLAAAHKEK